MDHFESMKVFIVASETGSLSATAKKLRSPLATISRKVSDLEAHLGVKLFSRSKKGLELTENGRTYFEASKKILEDLQAANRIVKGEYSEPKGNLTITAPIVFGRMHLIPLVSSFLKSYPDINIKLVLNDQNINLVDEHVDLALRLGNLPDSALISVRLGQVKLLTCASAEYLAARGLPKYPKDLINYDLITIDSLGAANSWTYFENKDKFSVRIRSRLVVSTVEAGLDAARAGVGITRALSYQVNSDVQNKKLKIILKDYEPEAIPVHFIYREGKVPPQKVRSFLDYATPIIRKILLN